MIYFVIPAKAGIQTESKTQILNFIDWILAYASMTDIYD